MGGSIGDLLGSSVGRITGGAVTMGGSTGDLLVSSTGFATGSELVGSRVGHFTCRVGPTVLRTDGDTEDAAEGGKVGSWEGIDEGADDTG